MGLVVAVVTASLVLAPSAPTSAPATQNWGYVGCSNTHDAMYGYQNTPGAAAHFWPWSTNDSEYHIEGGTVHNWLRVPTYFQQFEQQVALHDGGADPPIILIQFCVQDDPAKLNYWPLDQAEVAQLIAAVHAHHPSSVLYVTPLQDYKPTALCDEMGLKGIEIPTMKGWLAQQVAIHAALAGPGIVGNAALGPLAENGTVWTDDCHPTGDPHHPTKFPGSGVQLLGQQLSSFFDHLG